MFHVFFCTSKVHRLCPDAMLAHQLLMISKPIWTGINHQHASLGCLSETAKLVILSIIDSSLPVKSFWTTSKPSCSCREESFSSPQAPQMLMWGHHVGFLDGMTPKTSLNHPFPPFNHLPTFRMTKQQCVEGNAVAWRRGVIKSQRPVILRALMGSWAPHLAGKYIIPPWKSLLNPSLQWPFDTKIWWTSVDVISYRYNYSIHKLWYDICVYICKCTYMSCMFFSRFFSTEWQFCRPTELWTISSKTAS